MTLTTSGQEYTWWDDEPMAVAQFLEKNNLPFLELEKKESQIDADSGRSYSGRFFFCPWLLQSGRCGNYENRPNLCRNYQPMQDQLCVHFQGAEGTGEGL